MTPRTFSHDSPGYRALLCAYGIRLAFTKLIQRQNWMVWLWSSAVRIVRFSRSDCSWISPFTPATFSSPFLPLNPNLRTNYLAASVVSLPSSIRVLAVTNLPLESFTGTEIIISSALYNSYLRVGAAFKKLSHSCILCLPGRLGGTHHAEIAAHD